MNAQPSPEYYYTILLVLLSYTCTNVCISVLYWFLLKYNISFYLCCPNFHRFRRTFLVFIHLILICNQIKRDEVIKDLNISFWNFIQPSKTKNKKINIQIANTMEKIYTLDMMDCIKKMRLRICNVLLEMTFSTKKKSWTI